MKNQVKCDRSKFLTRSMIANHHRSAGRDVKPSSAPAGYHYAEEIDENWYVGFNLVKSEERDG